VMSTLLEMKKFVGLGLNQGSKQWGFFPFLEMCQKDKMKHKKQKVYLFRRDGWHASLKVLS